MLAVCLILYFRSFLLFQPHFSTENTLNTCYEHFIVIILCDGISTEDRKSLEPEWERATLWYTIGRQAEPQLIWYINGKKVNTVIIMDGRVCIIKPASYTDPSEKLEWENVS